MVYRVILFFICIGVVSSCSQPLVIQPMLEKSWSGIQVAVIPHHMLTRNKVNEFYALLAQQFPHPDRIVIISPNHFNIGSGSIESIAQPWDMCFRWACVPGVPYPEYRFSPPPFLLFHWTETEEHGIGEHFYFIHTYFSGTSVMPIVLRRTLVPGELETHISQVISWFSGTTLVLASVDFSHHVDEEFARFHDVLAVDVLSNGELSDFSKLEVDCRNCLAVAQLVAHNTGNDFFSFWARTSVDTILYTRSDIDNTSHIFGQFSNSGSHTMTGVFAFVWDTQIARGIEEFDIKKSWFLSNIFRDFYEKKDIKKLLSLKYNRIWVGFDFFVANLEATFDTDTCDNKWQGIILRMKRESIDKIRSIGINMFNLANNHSDDCGGQNFSEMHTWMKNQWIPAFGDAKNGDEYLWTGMIRGEKFAFVWVNSIETSVDWPQKIEKIRTLTNSWFLVIANFHWWKEFSPNITDNQRKIAHDAIDAGARLIIWHHPHVVQPKELYKNIPIYYSLGNFLFDQDFPETLPGIMALCEVSRLATHCEDTPFDRTKNTFAIRFR